MTRIETSFGFVEVTATRGDKIYDLDNTTGIVSDILRSKQSMGEVDRQTVAHFENTIRQAGEIYKTAKDDLEKALQSVIESADGVPNYIGVKNINLDDGKMTLSIELPHAVRHYEPGKTAQEIRTSDSEEESRGF